MTFDNWCETFKHQIENIIEYIYLFLSNVQETGYKYYINKHLLKELVSQYMYKVSSNNKHNHLKHA
jgi:hypothetical protein